MTAETSERVDLDQVLLVAARIRKICHKCVKVGVSFPTFKRESLEAAIAHVQDLDAGRQPSLHSDGAFYRLLACCPKAAWLWECLEGLRNDRVYDGRGEDAGGRR